ncbi:hypothetical protein [Spirosoma aerophilum]
MDAIDCDKISGWAFANSGGYAYLDIYAPDLYTLGTGNMVKVATVKANTASRPDIRAAFGNNPNIPLDCGFVWAIPDTYKNGRQLTIKVVPVNDVSPIGNSPMTTSGNCDKPVTPGGTTGPWNPSLPPEVLQISKFYIDMTNLGINFSDEERAVIAEYNLYERIQAYVNQYGSKPDGNNKFIMSPIDQLLYPKFTNLVKNNIVTNVMTNPKILNALKTFSGFNDEKILGLLKMGSGPRIIIKQIPSSGKWMEEGYTYGYFKYNEDPNVVNIDYKTVQAYEAENSWPEMEKAWFTLLANLLIHETAHYGAYHTQTLDVIDGPTSNGPHKFDIAAFGYAALPGNVIDEIVLKNGK